MTILKNMFLSVKEFNEKYVIYPLTLIQNNRKGFIDENVLFNIDIFIHQDIREENQFGYKLSDKYIRQYLNRDCMDMTIPNLFGFGEAFYPQFHHNVLNKKIGRDRNGMFPHGDLFIDKCMQERMGKDEIISLILEGEPFSKQEILENFNKNMDKIFEREKNWDIHIYNFIKDNYKKQQLFFDRGHPTNIIMSEIAKQVLRKIGISKEIHCEEIMDSFEEFVYPCVTKVLSLEWKQTEIRKSNNARKFADRMDISEYVKEYIYWCYHEYV